MANTYGRCRMDPSRIRTRYNNNYISNLSYLTDGICFDEACRVNLTAPTKYIFKLNMPIQVSTIGFVGSYSALDNCKIYLSNDKETLWDEHNNYVYDAIPLHCSKKDVAAASLFIESTDKSSYIGLDFKTSDGFPLKILFAIWLDCCISEINWCKINTATIATTP